MGKPPDAAAGPVIASACPDICAARTMTVGLGGHQMRPIRLHPRRGVPSAPMQGVRQSLRVSAEKSLRLPSERDSAPTGYCAKASSHQ